MALRSLLTKLNQDPAFAALADGFGREEKARAWVTGIWGSGGAFFWAGLRERLRRPMLLATSTAEEARLLYDRLRLFLEHPDPDREELFLFPGREILPYEHALTDMETEGERLEVLLRLARGERLVVVAALEQVRERLPDPAWLLEQTFTLHVGQNLSLESLAEQLTQRGYVREAAISARGEFAIRGGIVDIFPPAELAPLRLELEGTQVATLRRFSLAGETPALGAGNLGEALISPARLGYPGPEDLRRGWALLERQQGRERVRPLREAWEADASRPGLENYSPCFLPLAGLIDYFPPGVIVVTDSPGEAKQQSERDDLRNRRLHEEHSRKEPLLPKPEELFQPFEALGESLLPFPWISSGRLHHSAWPESGEVRRWSVVLKGTTPMRGSLDLLMREARALSAQGLELHLLSHNRAEEQRLRQLLAERVADLPSGEWLSTVHFHQGQLDEGFQYPACGLVVFTDQELFNRHLGRPRARRQKGSGLPSQPVLDALELKAGDVAVHRDHGVAHYRGIVKLSVDGSEREFLCLLYAGEEKLYVPMDQLSLVGKYLGGDQPRINRLGGTSWERTKQRVRESVAKLARELLDIYAARQVHPGHAFAPDTPWQKEFEEAFAFEETPDQLRAIEEVKRDMEQSKPMDRLVCGDVGFGKTEVAMRAAFKAVQDGRQVAMLVPTTILADQHYATFRERMAAYPVRIELLSRFKNAAEQKRILTGLEQGAVEIVVGTHKLLSSRAKFQKLGLLILDEEQHFGVAQKEKLKQFRSTVDVLTLTATPIPRTLYFSLSGLRDISVIETPPLNRMAIRTSVMEYSEGVIREAVLREMGRGGQCFFIHNRVQSIQIMAERLKRLVPEARIAVAHGQMTRDELEPVMEKFLARSEDILISTTIVESGLDLPNVNTIFINRADALGLSELYQLRGRVGRADRQAYAYLFYPEGGGVTRNAEKRLSTLQEFTELGSGLRIAMRDLEIRGAGDVLGPEQSGQVTAVGFETYASLLEEAVKELRGQKTEAPAEVKVSLPLDAYLPAEYVPEATVRLNLYKRLAGVKNSAELHRLSGEIEQRFGTLPLPARHLLQAAEIKGLAREAGLAELAAGPERLRLAWRKRGKLPEKWLEKLSRLPGRKPRVLQADPLEIEVGRPAGDWLAGIKNLLSELS